MWKERQAECNSSDHAIDVGDGGDGHECDEGGDSIDGD